MKSVANRCWNIILKIMMSWSLVSCAVSTYTIIILLIYFNNGGFSERNHGSFLGIIVAQSFFVFTYCLLLLRRKELRRIITELIKLAEDTDQKILVRFRLGTSLAFLLTIGYSLYLVCIVCRYTYDDFQRNSNRSESYSHMCFGCDTSSWDKRYIMVFFQIYLSLTTSSSVCLSCLQVTLYCSLSWTLANVLNSCISAFEVDCRLTNLKPFLERFSRIRTMVADANNVFKNMVFIWLGSTVVTTCHNFTVIIGNFTLTNSNSLQYMDPFYMKDFFLLMALTLVASKLSEEADRILDVLPRIKKDSLTPLYTSELLLFYSEYNAKKMGFKAGSCFLITKNLLLSFLGLALTYTVVFIQFNPKAMAVLTHSTITSLRCSPSV